MVERYFEAMAKPKPAEIMEKYKRIFKLEGVNDLGAGIKYKETITDFVAFIKKAEAQVKV